MRAAIWTAVGRPVLVETGRHRGGGLTEVVPDRRVGDIGATAVERAHGALVPPPAHRLRLGRGDRREQNIVVDEDRVDPLGDHGFAAHRAPQGPAVQSPPPPRHAPRSGLEPFGVVELGRVVGDPGEVARHRVGQQLPVLGIALGDLVAERAQQLGGFLDRPPRDRAGLHARKRPLQRHRDAQTTGLPARRVGEADLRLGRRVRVAGGGPAQRVVEQRGIEHAASQAAEHRQPVPVLGVGQRGDAPPRRLEPEQPAQGRRNPDGRTAVGAQARRARGPPRRRRPCRRSTLPRPARCPTGCAWRRACCDSVMCPHMASSGSAVLPSMAPRRRAGGAPPRRRSRRASRARRCRDR